MGNFAIRTRRSGVLLGAGVFLAAMALVAAAFRIAATERTFEFNRWTIRLQNDSTQPLRTVNGWLSASHAALRDVAVNPTVQIYLSQIAANPSSRQTPESEAQSAFLESYVASLGGRGPFGANGQLILPQGVLLGLLSPGGGKPKMILVHTVQQLGELLASGYSVIVIDLSNKDSGKPIQLASN